MGVTSAWWRESAQRAEEAGFSAVWCWDHFVSRGRDKATPVLECWTTLTAAAAATRRLRVGSFVTNVMNRHPAVLARMLATLADQSANRVDLGIGVGGYAPEMEAYGIAFPDAAERSSVLEEATAVLRRLWSGGPVDYDGRHFRLRQAYAHPVPQPAPRIIVGGQSAARARLAARTGDGWTTNARDYEELLPIHLAELERHGRRRVDVVHAIEVQLARDQPLEAQPVVADMAAYVAEWAERGADELIVSYIRPNQLDALLDAAERAGLKRPA
ncbi:MAG: LLM class flavin-dependent oxidoreductase [Chloroflexota bacterium]|nr:LLM class flavin-dependent oxidoreductase [Chloroflexota bacterium]